MTSLEFLHEFTTELHKAVKDHHQDMTEMRVTVWSDDELHEVTGVRLTGYAPYEPFVLEIQTRSISVK
jgi:hypothetical protein